MRREETQLIVRWGAFIGVLAGLTVASWAVISQSEEQFRTTPAFLDMETAKLTLVNDNNEQVEIEVRVADSEQKRIAGFADIGSRVIQRSVILLVYERDTQTEFSMRQVVEPLDLAFIGSDGAVLQIIRTEPHREAPYSFGVSFRYVLEAPAGFFANLHVSNSKSFLDLNTIADILPSPGPAN